MRQTSVLGLAWVALLVPGVLRAERPELVLPQGHSNHVSSVALSADGKFALTGSWDLPTGSTVQTLRGRTAPVFSVAVSADGTRVLTGSADGTALLWDAGSGRKLQTCAGHKQTVSSVALSPDGTRILTGSHDNTAF